MTDAGFGDRGGPAPHPTTAGDDPASVAVLDLAEATQDPDRPLPGQPDRPTSLRRVVGAIVLVLMGVSAAYSANAWGLRDRFRPPASYLGGRTPAAPTAQGPAVADGAVARPAHNIRSQPWWQAVTTLRGEGNATTETFTIDRHALQWRVKWKCSAGSFHAVPVHEAGGARPRPLAQATCPGDGTGFSVRSGRFTVQVTGGGAWQMTVEQQLDAPMVEPAPPGLDSPDAQVLATGSFYDVDRTGRGTVRIVALPDGRRVLRLDDFFVSINSDLEIWFSEHPHPRTTPEAASAPHRRLEFLEATAGSMNYDVPPDFDVSRYRSIVIWCELTSNAYAAATLER